MAAADSGLAHLEKDLVFFDCEMTGGDLDRHDIIEIGAVRSRLPELSVVAELSLKVEPRTTRGANQTSLRIAGYSAKDWKSAVSMQEALSQLGEFAAGGIFVGWATYNDLLFVQAAVARLGMENFAGDAYVELQDWAQQRLHLALTPGLQRVANQLKIVRDEEHSAIEDALVTYEVFRMLWRYDSEEIDRILPSLDWNSYADLTGPIEVSDAQATARRLELARYIMVGTGRDELLARRGGFRRG
ncbi:MAG: Exonuclease RNase and polymerase [Chloroflexi bacterium]|nr:Exonuclease RNase and polymerase [Chloroflexota bacterium]